MGKLPFILKAITGKKTDALFSTSEIAIKNLEKAKQKGGLSKATADFWIAEIRKNQKAAKKDIKKNELETDT